MGLVAVLFTQEVLAAGAGAWHHYSSEQLPAQHGDYPVAAFQRAGTLGYPGVVDEYRPEPRPKAPVYWKPPPSKSYSVQPHMPSMTFRPLDSNASSPGLEYNGYRFRPLTPTQEQWAPAGRGNYRPDNHAHAQRDATARRAYLPDNSASEWRDPVGRRAYLPDSHAPEQRVPGAGRAYLPDYSAYDSRGFPGQAPVERFRPMEPSYRDRKMHYRSYDLLNRDSALGGRMERHEDLYLLPEASLDERSVTTGELPQW